MNSNACGGCIPKMADCIARCINYTFRLQPPEVTINTLPDEILLHIFQYLDLDGVLACERVSRRWRKVALDAGVWRQTVVVCSAQHGQWAYLKDIHYTNLARKLKESQGLRLKLDEPGYRTFSKSI